MIFLLLLVEFVTMFFIFIPDAISISHFYKDFFPLESRNKGKLISYYLRRVGEKIIMWNDIEWNFTNTCIVEKYIYLVKNNYMIMIVLSDFLHVTFVKNLIIIYLVKNTWK